MTDYYKDVSNMDDETIAVLITTLTREKEKRKSKARDVNICKIKNMLAEIDKLCIEYNININTNDYYYDAGDTVLLHNLFVG